MAGIRDFTLALAGIFQASSLVRQVACKGSVDSDMYQTCINSLFILQPKDTESVYGGRENIQHGLQILSEQFGSSERKRDFEITKYVVSVMHLERKLAKRPEMVRRIREGIEATQTKLDHFSLLHENVIAQLADLYVNTISTLTPRIIVNGEHGYLSNPNNANKVRALLLAAIRSAVLWRQNGGNRFQLIFKRSKIVQQANQLIV